MTTPEAFRYLNSPSSYGSPDEYAPECSWCDGRGTLCTSSACFTAPLPVTGVRIRMQSCWDSHACDACKGTGYAVEVQK